MNQRVNRYFVFLFSLHFCISIGVAQYKWPYYYYVPDVVAIIFHFISTLYFNFVFTVGLYTKMQWPHVPPCTEPIDCFNKSFSQTVYELTIMQYSISY